MMMEKALTLDTNGDGQPDAIGISRSSALATVEVRRPCCKHSSKPRSGSPDRPFCAPQKYVDYAKQQVWLDGVFDEFDADKSGKLSEDQVRALSRLGRQRPPRGADVPQPSLPFVCRRSCTSSSRRFHQTLRSRTTTSITC